MQREKAVAGAFTKGAVVQDVEQSSADADQAIGLALLQTRVDHRPLQAEARAEIVLAYRQRRSVHQVVGKQEPAGKSPLGSMHRVAGPDQNRRRELRSAACLDGLLEIAVLLDEIAQHGDGHGPGVRIAQANGARHCAVHTQGGDRADRRIASEEYAFHFVAAFEGNPRGNQPISEKSNLPYLFARFKYDLGAL